LQYGLLKMGVTTPRVKNIYNFLLMWQNNN
jgi:hypothetical protein